MSDKERVPPDRQLTHGSLFSGIGGIDLGFERAGMKTLWQVECDDYATKVLEKHWPDVKRYRDVREVGKHNLEPVDVISGGFPCQDLSVAGKRGGIHAGRSGLWWEMLRIACELRPRILVVENVPNLLAGADGEWARVFFGSLAESGFDCEWDIVSAADMGAPHLRKRVFVVAYATSRGQRDELSAGTQTRNPTRPESSSGSQDVADATCRGAGPAQLTGQRRSPVEGGDDVPDAAGARQATGQCGARWAVRNDTRRARLERLGSEVPDADGTGCSRACGRISRDRDTSRRTHAGNGGPKIPDAAEPRLERPEPAREVREGCEGLSAERGAEWWSVEPDVGRVVDGFSVELDFSRQITEWHHATRNNPKTQSTRNELVKRLLRAVWEHRGLATTSPDLYVKCLRDSVPEVPLRDSQSRWFLGPRIEGDQELRGLWEAFYAEPLEKAQDMQFILLERAWSAKRFQTVGHRADRLRCLGNAVVPQVAEFIGRRIVEAADA